LRGDLANQGPLLLSRDNPFLAQNLYVALERDNSPLIAKFIKHRGEPDAVEVRTRWMRSDRVYFFYLDKREAYVFERRDVSWVVRGPERIPRDIFDKHFSKSDASRGPKLARKSEPSAESDAALAVDEYINDPSEPKFIDRAREPLPPAAYEETPPERAPFLRESAQRREPDPKLPRTIPQSSNELLGMRRGTTPQAASGDLLHTVSYPGETLRMIAAWFTGSPDNAARIARINGIENPDLLFMGQQVRIPRYLVKTLEPLPEEEVEQYLQRMSESPR
jgi:hypothetical protein